MRCLFNLLSLFTSLVLITLPVHADFSFVHITDTHVGATDAPKSNAALDAVLFKEISNLNPRPAFVFNTGDVCEIGTDAEYAIYQKTLASLTIPRYDAPGNHDVRWNPRGKEGYTIGAKQPLYQSWDYENIHFVVLDSTVLLQHWGHFDQAMLDWLAADLAKIGRDKPVVIGFHHWIGRESVMVDNEAALLDVVAPYNVRLWLQGHGHSDIKWNINGTPAIMAKGLYQGSYNLIQVTKDTMRVLRRTQEKPTPTQEVMTIPLARPQAPRWDVSLQHNPATGDVRVTARQGDLPATAQLSYRLNSAKAVPMQWLGGDWTAVIPTTGLSSGEYSVSVVANLPDGRTYTRAQPLSLRKPISVSPAPLANLSSNAWNATLSPAWVLGLGGAIQSRLVRDGNTLYVTTMGGDLVALEPTTGFELWRFKTQGAVFSTPHITGNTVYIGSADHYVYAVDAATGRQKWKTKTGGAVFAGAAVAQGVVCIASVDTKIYGLDATTGKVLWTAQGEGMYQSKATTDGTRFFVGGWDNFFRALDVKTGKEVWKNKFGRSFYYAPAIGSPTVGDGKVFVTSNDGYLHAMDAVSGKVLWEVPGPAMGYSGPLFLDGRIYNASLTGTGIVFCFDAATGKKLWETPTGSVIYDSSTAFGGGNVYVGSVSGTFSAIRAADGAMQWQYYLGPGHVLASPATDAGRVYIGSMSGRVTALPLTISH